MFLIQIGRSPRATRPTFQCDSCTCGTMQVHFEWAPEYCTFSRNGDRRELRVVPLASIFGEAGPAHVSIDFDPGRGEFKLRRRIESNCPLYVWESPEGECCLASHVSLLKQAGVILRQNDRVLAEYYMYRFIMPPATLFEGIRQLHGGSRMTLTIGDEGCRSDEIVLDPLPMPAESGDADVAAREGQDRFQEILHRFRPVAERSTVLLSGGLDSSVMYRIAQTELGIRESFGTGYPFEDPSLNMERQYSISAAEALGAEHTFFETTTGNYLESIVRCIAAAEVPLGHLQAAMFLPLYRTGMSDRHQLSLCGLGCDAIFTLPMQTHIFRARKPAFRMLRTPPLKSLFGLAVKATGRGGGILNNLDSRFFHFPDLADPNHVLWRQHEYGHWPWVRDRLGLSREELIEDRYRFMKQFDSRSIYDLISLLDIYGDVVFTIGMFGQIARHARRHIVFPMIDQDLTTWAFGLNWEMRLTVPKHVLRIIARNVGVPEFIIRRRKTGFGIKRQDWGAEGGPLQPLTRIAAKVAGREELRALQGERGTPMMFWIVIAHAIWHRLFIGGESVDDLVGELKEAL